MAYLGCQFAFEGVTREAIIRELSLKGAFLLSTFMPPQGGNVIVTLKTPFLENTLVLEGTVVRSGCGLSGRGTAGTFTIRFNHSSSDLIELFNKLDFRY